MKNPKWTREELILALDLYFKVSRSAIHATNLDVIALSDLLNRLRSADPQDPLKFRNPNGVAMKLHNFSSLDARTNGSGLSHAGRLDAEIWNEFSEQKSRLLEEALRIRQSIN